MNGRVGILFHGPEIFDKGEAQKVIDSLEEYEIFPVLGGTMGKTALLDNDLPEVEVTNEKPSESLKNLAQKSDRIIIATHAKSTKSGLSFVSIILEKIDIGTPLLHLEWNEKWMIEYGDCPRLRKKFGELGFEKHDKKELGRKIWKENGKVHRRVQAVSPGEYLMVEGIVVGKVKSEDVIITTENNKLEELKGIEPKTHGIKKLDKLDLKKARIDSAKTLRPSTPEPRTMKKVGDKIFFLEHNAKDTYQYVNRAEGVVVVGDDTTKIAGDILYRFGIPVIGIRDEDSDQILKEGNFAEGSILLTVSEDDKFGGKVFEKVFGSKNEIDGRFEEVKAEILGMDGINEIEKV